MVPRVPLTLVTALRAVVRQRRFSLAVVLSLGLGIGAGASLFGVVDVLLLRPPAGIGEPGRVRNLVLHEHNDRIGDFTSTGLAWIDYEQMRTTRALAGVAGWFTLSQSLGRGAGARRIRVTGVTPSFFPVLEAHPSLGRFFAGDEDVLAAAVVPCVASDGFWRSELGGTTQALGRRLDVGEKQCTIIGVAAPGFNGLELNAVDLWMPLRALAPDYMGTSPDLWSTDRSHWLRIVARLAPGVSDADATNAATVAYRAFSPRTRDPQLHARAAWESIIPGRASTRPGSVNVAALLLAGAGVLLLLIVANLVNLFLVRDLTRLRETTIRVALGSSAWHLLQTRLVEAGLLAALAGIAGVVVARVLGPLARGLVLRGVHLTSPILDIRVIIVAATIVLLVGAVIAAVSTWRVLRVDPAAMLRASGAAQAEMGGGRVLRGGLVALQAAISTALVISSGAFSLSLLRALDVSLGFDLDHVVTAEVPLGDGEYDMAARRRFYVDARRRLAALPGIESASLGYMVPWWNNRSERVSIPGRDSLPPDPVFGEPVFDAVTPDYQRTMGLRMAEGRFFTEGDAAGAAPVIVVNEALARLYWPGRSAIGQCLRVGADSMPCRQVAGVVANYRFTGRLDSRPVAAYLVPLAQADAYPFTPKLFLRTRGDAAAAIAGIRTTLQSLTPNLPAASVVPLRDRFAPLVSAWQLGTWAFTALGVLAVFVGAFGLFSILSFVVAERRREFAIRAAVGATVGQIALPVVGEGLRTVGAGIAAGVLVTLALAHWLDPMLFHTRLAEPMLVAGAMLLSLVIAMVASAGPARQAAAQDPVEMLRAE